MSIFSRLLHWRRKDSPPLLPPGASNIPRPPVTSESVNMDNVKAKMDLVLTQIENLKVQNETLNERVKNMEKSVAEILAIAKA